MVQYTYPARTRDSRAWKVATAVDLHMDLVRQLYVYCTIELKKIYLSMDLVRF